MNNVLLQGFACVTIHLKQKNHFFHASRLTYKYILFCHTLHCKLVNHISSFMKHTPKNSITYYLAEKLLHNEINDKKKYETHFKYLNAINS